MNATKSIYNISLLDVLPNSILADKKMKALAQSLDNHLQLLSSDSKFALHLPRLDELDHNILDLLAEQYHVDFYEPERMSADTKRLLIRESLHQHYKLGTRFAVEKLLNVLSSNAKIIEWFESVPNLPPFHFKVEITGLRDLHDDGERIIRAINVAKNARSHCTEFDFKLHSDFHNLHVALPTIQQGSISRDLQSRFTDNHHLKLVQAHILTGKLLFHPPNENLVFNHRTRATFATIQTGNIKFSCNTDIIDSESYNLYLFWLKNFWRRFNLNPVVKHYSNLDDPDDDDFWNEEQFSGNFIKLWTSYHNDDKTRLFVFPSPRDDLSPADINALPVDGIFINRRNNLSDKIIHAVLVKKSITRLSI